MDKPLIRAKDESSRIFMTSRAPDPASPEPAPGSAPERPTGNGPLPRVLQLRPPAVALTRGALGAMIKELQDGLESGLRVLDVSVPCYPVGEIDLLAIDRSNQLVIIDFDTASSETLLLRGIGHYNWVLHNLPNLERMYAQHSINLMAEPRLFLLAPRFSPLVANAIRHITKPAVQWLRYHVVEAMPGSFGILFERFSEEGG